MRIDVRGCAEFQELRPPRSYSKVVSIIVKDGMIKYLYKRGIPATFNLQDVIEGCWGTQRQREIALLKKHFPEAFI